MEIKRNLLNVTRKVISKYVMTLLSKTFCLFQVLGRIFDSAKKKIQLWFTFSYFSMFDSQYHADVSIVANLSA